ncbi:MAG: response regulator [Stagnimonas sp.]|nr:response regulator [Stagnimonas sp.]
MSAPTRLALIVEDEPAIRRFLRATLAANGYEVLEAATAHAGLSLARSEKPDVLILDLGLPDRDGLDLLRELRAESQLPVLVLSARDTESAKVAALDLGADDYITKPFGAEELMARLRVALRHRLRAEGDAPHYQRDGLVVDVLRRQVSLHGQPLHLSPKEYLLLELLARHAGKVLTHRQLLERLWPEGGEADAQYLRVYVRQLRQKLGDTAEAPRWLLTEAGVGYRLLAPG